jgi:uncharacterized protein YbaP (TraB family)
MLEIDQNRRDARDGNTWQQSCSGKKPWLTRPNVTGADAPVSVAAAHSCSDPTSSMLWRVQSAGLEASGSEL